MAGGRGTYILGCEFDTVVEEVHDLLAVEEVVARVLGGRDGSGEGSAADGGGTRRGAGAGALLLVVVGAERERWRRRLQQHPRSGRRPARGRRCLRWGVLGQRHLVLSTAAAERNGAGAEGVWVGKILELPVVISNFGGNRVRCGTGTGTCRVQQTSGSITDGFEAAYLSRRSWQWYPKHDEFLFYY